MPAATGRRGYRGRDRRAAVQGASTTDRSWIVGGVGLCLLLVGLAWSTGDGDVQPLALAVRSSGLILASLLALAGLLYWRATGEAAGYLVATAGWLIGVGILAEMAYPSPTAGWFILCASPATLAAVWIGRAIVAPAVDASSGPRREAIVAVGSLVVLWGGATGLVAVIDVPLRSLVTLLYVGAAAIWGVVSLLGILRAVRGTSALRSWIAWMAVCLTLSIAAYLLGFIHLDSWAPIGGALRLSGLLIGVIGAAVALTRNAIARREAQYRQSLAHRNERRRQLASERERDHELRTALLAIEGATATLERHREHLDAAQLESLSGAVRTGMEDLRAMTVAREPAPSRPVTEVVAGHAALSRARGLAVRLDVPDHLDVEVDPGTLGHVLHNLLVNAERHGGREGPVTVDIEVRPADDGVTITVRDDGPGIPQDQLERIFERGRRLDDRAPGEGIGLSVSRRLIRAAGGDLIALPSADGACFEVRLRRPQVVGEFTDEPQEVGDVGEVADGAAAGTADQPSTERGGPVVQYHRQLGSRLRRLRRHDGQVEDLRRDGAIQDDRHVSDLVDQGTQAVAEQRRDR